MSDYDPNYTPDFEPLDERDNVGGYCLFRVLGVTLLVVLLALALMAGMYLWLLHVRYG